MIRVSEMLDQYFKLKSLNKNKLIPFGFTLKNGIYVYETAILDGQFKVIIEIDASGEIKTQVIDVFTEEPYTLHLVDSASGTFVGSVRAEYERVLSGIADNCFERDVFKSKQAHEVINYISEKYGDNLEFLWEKLPSAAIWRRKDNKKWYGIIMTISKRKLGINSDEQIDIIDLRAEPDEISCLVDNVRVFVGYHMNKKHWITIPLYGVLPVNEICKLIDKSYFLANKK